MRILVFGLPGSGKTTFADALAHLINASRINADVVRTVFADWDFSEEGRARQAERMRMLSIWEHTQHAKHVVVDFVAPTAALRAHFAADYAIWMDTIAEGRFEDTNRAWRVPTESEYHATVTEFDAINEAARIHTLLQEGYYV